MRAERNSNYKTIQLAFTEIIVSRTLPRCKSYKSYKVISPVTTAYTTYTRIPLIPYCLTSYNMLNGLSRGNFLTLLKPASLQYSLTFEGGIPKVPRPSPPSANDVVIQYIMLQP